MFFTRINQNNVLILLNQKKLIFETANLLCIKVFQNMPIDARIYKTKYARILKYPHTEYMRLCVIRSMHD